MVSLNLFHIDFKERGKNVFSTWNIPFKYHPLWDEDTAPSLAVLGTIDKIIQINRLRREPEDNLLGLETKQSASWKSHQLFAEGGKEKVQNEKGTASVESLWMHASCGTRWVHDNGRDVHEVGMGGWERDLHPDFYLCSWVMVCAMCTKATLHHFRVNANI